MAFMSLEINFEKNKCYKILPFIFLILLLPSFLIERPYNTFQGKVSKGIGVTISNVFKEFVMTLLASTQIFYKKK